MALILNIETSTQVCSVSIALNGRTEAIKESHTKNSHAELLTIFAQQLISDLGYEFKDLDAVSVSKGPGSYTGLRIGVSTAKGLCYSLDKPLIAITTLEAMAAGMIQKTKNTDISNTVFCPMIDARRMEVYSALYSADLSMMRKIKAEIIDGDSFAHALEKHKIVFGGDGAAKCKEVLSNNTNAVFLDDFLPSSQYMSQLAETKFAEKDFEDLAYFEPFYLKDFIAGKPRVKGLR
ncbi:MAG: tRNA (adenosine(37)-N6)-threonylcarbamoyltransferase complex dimerization subunit type 1 TsaB [Chlorobi bacterium]|nr:tRNA (adenosine(37)-N6)-threonylcarbamoyltransferase complex dimerization subunit type 1 TsaB [Chlorobiota bacterium]